jgi:DNA-binding NarL/FixJ family response regulator
MRVLLAEDDAVVGFILGALIDSEPDLELVGTVVDADAAIASAASVTPDVAILDVRMPGGGARAAREISRVSPTTRILAFSGATDPAVVQEMMDAGASRYIVKGTDPEMILAAIRGAGE